MTLHLVNKPPSNPAVTSCFAAALPGDTIVLIEHGVYCESLNAPDGVAMCALEIDVRARGLNSTTPADIRLIDDARFVELACKHNPIVTWS